MTALLLLAIALANAPQPSGLLAQAPPSPPPAVQQQPNPCDVAEYRQFDFWIGTWEVKGPKGNTLGKNVVEALTSKCGIHENWVGGAGGSGQSLNTYVRSEGKWHQWWVGSGGSVLHLIGGLKDGAMVMEGTTAGRNGTTVFHRVTWTPRPGGLRQHWEQSNDAGKTWTTAFDGYYASARSLPDGGIR